MTEATTMSSRFPEGPTALWLRLSHDADEIRRIADWLDIGAESLPKSEADHDRALKDQVAFDYFRLAARLDFHAKEARGLAVAMSRPIP